VGSIADIVFVASQPTTTEEVNDAFRQEATTERYQEVLGVSDDPLVSADIVGDPRAAVVDLELTTVVDGTLVKVMAWYDNEWGFTHQMIREARDTLGVPGGYRNLGPTCRVEAGALHDSHRLRGVLAVAGESSGGGVVEHGGRSTVELDRRAPDQLPGAEDVWGRRRCWRPAGQRDERDLSSVRAHV
jgi:hypothetical protein